MLIKSISGIRGTIGGKPGDSFTPIDIVKFTSAYAERIIRRMQGKKASIVVGRDARISGEMVINLVMHTLSGYGIDVLDCGLATTPTVEMAVIQNSAEGGIIITASHNPFQWNALKLLNEKGEFISDADGKEILEIAQNERFCFAPADQLGKVFFLPDSLEKHIQSIIDLNLVNKSAIEKANFKIVIDCVNSVGGLALPEILGALGVRDLIELNCEPSGIFAHNPEPLPEHLTEISNCVVKEKAHLGFVVDPDVDRLAIICEDGSMFGEEYTLVAVADYILSINPGNTVSNLSSTRALMDVTQNYGGKYTASAVGEVNVVNAMKETSSVIGGEGNGGIIYPELHYGRDALVGIALFLTHLALSGKSCLELRNSYPNYFMSKTKIELKPSIDMDALLNDIKSHYSKFKITDIDGVRIDFDNEWVHIRKSNTEPIVRIYSESTSLERARDLTSEIESLIISLQAK